MGKTNWSTLEAENRLRSAVAKSKSIAEVLRELNLQVVGGNYRTIKYHITRLNIDVSHHTGRAWNKENYKIPEGSSKKHTWKQYLIRTHGHTCMKCLLSVWNDLPIPLELEHIDGNTYNNLEKNLMLLCPNCHAQTPTYRRAKSSLRQ